MLEIFSLVRKACINMGNTHLLPIKLMKVSLLNLRNLAGDIRCGECKRDLRVSDPTSNISAHTDGTKY